MNRESQKAARSGARYIAIATQLPFTAIGGYALGYGLDHLFGTTWLRVFFLFVGIVGGFAQLIYQILKDQKSK